MFFFFNDTATTEIYTLSLHDALPIYHHNRNPKGPHPSVPDRALNWQLQRINQRVRQDRKSTRLNSSHLVISYAVFCLKKKKHRNNFGTVGGCGRARLWYRSLSCRGRI